MEDSSPHSYVLGKKPILGHPIKLSRLSMNSLLADKTEFILKIRVCTTINTYLIAYSRQSPASTRHASHPEASGIAALRYDVI